MSDAGFINHYEVLGVTPNASRAVIDKAFRLRVAQNPEAFLHAPDAAAATHVRRAKEARDVLRDAAARAAFDRVLERREHSLKAIANDLAGPGTRAQSSTGDAALDHILNLLSDAAFEDNAAAAARRQSLAERADQILRSTRRLNLEEAVAARIIAIARRYLAQPACVQMAETVLSHNPAAPRQWCAALIEHPAFATHGGNGAERRLAAKALAKIIAQFPRFGREFAEAISLLALDHPDLETLQSLTSRSDSGSGAAAGAHGRGSSEASWAYGGGRRLY